MSDVVFSSVDGDLVFVHYGSEHEDVRDHLVGVGVDLTDCRLEVVVERDDDALLSGAYRTKRDGEWRVFSCAGVCPLLASGSWVVT